MKLSQLLRTLLIVALFHMKPTLQNAVKLTQENIDGVLQTNNIVLVNFYADWCRFSQMLKPIFQDVAQTIKQEFPQPGGVVLAELDCDKQGALSSKYHISKYPTLKIFRQGKLAKREYRGQRSRDAIINFVRQQMVEPVNVLISLGDLKTKLDEKKRTIIGYFSSKDLPDYATFTKVASALKDDCQFWVGIGDNFKSEMTAGNSVSFRPPRTKDQDMLYLGSLTNYNLLHTWSYDKCVPLVREITFENGEELTEEGLPFMILFHRPDDTDIVDRYTKQIAKELANEKGSINFLTADGTKFSHPLKHIGKTSKDLPVIAIDSFRHMYLFPDINNIDVPGQLKQFIQDLHSGKLHREFHHGPDTKDSKSAPRDSPHGSKVTAKGTTVQEQKPESPPESTFKKLKPSEQRYTLLRKDEL